MAIESRQTALEYSDIRSLYALANDRATDDLAALKDDVFALISLINNNAFTPIQGSGSPEGVVTSNNSLTYIDTDNAPTSVDVYINLNAGEDEGWILTT